MKAADAHADEGSFVGCEREHSPWALGEPPPAEHFAAIGEAAGRPLAGDDVAPHDDVGLAAEQEGERDHGVRVPRRCAFTVPRGPAPRAVGPSRAPVRPAATPLGVRSRAPAPR